ncbi:MAG: hypothetical protein R3293_02790 [Candidatus Promineifilaceae bacterium]|nr:hypothetical protein [Candidatus Promineifilaceae bacterium]
MSTEMIRNFGLVIFGMMTISLILSIIIFLVVIRRLKRLDVPPNAGFAETLLYTPFLLVVFIDLLDFALDILAVPFSWAILDRLGLKALRNIAAFEALLPFTQLIPTMTLAWFAARLLGPKLDIMAK